MFFALMLVFGAMNWKLSNAIREERAAAIREEAKREREQRTDRKKE